MNTSRRFGIRSIFKVRRHDIDLHVGLAATFASGASDCAARARELQVADTTPQYILTFHAIELALKGYLAFKGYDAQQLKNKYGHGLAKMYIEARRRGLQIHVQDVDELLRWADEHHGNGSLKYGLSPYQMLPKCSELFPIVEQILIEIPIQPFAPEGAPEA